MAAKGLDEAATQRLMQFFVDLVASDGLRFQGAPEKFTAAGFGLAGDPVKAEAGLTIEFGHESRAGQATVVDSPSRPSVLMTLVTEERYDPRDDFDKMLKATLPGAPELSEDGDAMRVYDAEVAGRNITFNLLWTDRDGIFQIAMVAMVFLDEEAGDGAQKAEEKLPLPPFDRLPAKPKGASAARTRELLERFATLLAEDGPWFDGVAAKLKKQGFQPLRPRFFVAEAGDAEFEFSGENRDAKNVRAILRLDVAEETPIVSLLREVFAAKGEQPLEGPGEKEWREALNGRIGGYQTMVVALPQEQEGQRSIAIAAFCFPNKES